MKKEIVKDIYSTDKISKNFDKIIKKTQKNIKNNKKNDKISKNFDKPNQYLAMNEYEVNDFSCIKNSTIGKGSCIKKSEIEDCEIAENVSIKSSYIESSKIGTNSTIGPFAHIRPNSVIGKNCRIGNFCEIKNSTIGNGTKISHLAYVGDAKIGKNCNIGCGVIFVNYNGKIKQQIEIGDNVFVGSNCNLIAPLKIENNVYICAGTTVTQNLFDGDFVIGRAKESIKSNKAYMYLKDKVKWKIHFNFKKQLN